MSKKAAEHHKQSAEHHTHAARHHGEAAKHHESGDHEKAAHHAHTARGHALHATSADSSTKDTHIIAASNLACLFGREAAAQHRGDQMHPL